jgi:UDP-N-acetylmuramyl pentapeptide synthase
MEVSIKDTDQNFSWLLPSPGLHLAQNATLAFAVAQHLSAKPKDIIESLQNYTPVGARLRMESGPTGYQILNDVYNANPLSMLSSIQTLVALPQEQTAIKIALLGDMLEMGVQEIEHHQTLVEDILNLELHHVVLVGPRFQQAFRNLCDDGTKFPFAISAVSDSSDVVTELQKRQIFPFDQSVACLCKGSRGIKMERCIEDISSYHQQ